jgi:hypothetical protein
VRNTKSQQSEHRNHKESHAVTLEEEKTGENQEADLEEETTDLVTALDQEMIDLENQEAVLDSETTSHAVNSDQGKDLALVTTGHKIEIVMIDHVTALEI